MANYYVIQFTEIIDGEVFHRFYNRDRYLFSELNPADATHFNDREEAEYFAELELCDPQYARICDYFEISVVAMNVPYKVEITEEELNELLTWERTECDKHMKQLKEILA